MRYKIKILIKCILFFIAGLGNYNLFKKKLYFKEKFYYFSRFSRLHNYLQGVDKRLFQVFNTYGIEKNIIEEIGNQPIIDIGANIGEFSIGLRELMDFQGKIICIEPDNWEFKTLEKNAVLFNLTCVNCAIGSESKDGFLTDDNFDANSRLLLANENTEFCQTVKIKTLNQVLIDLNVNNFGLIKIEAEGFEPEVLLGLDLNKINVQFFAIDCGPERPPENSNTVAFCLNYLTNFGYKLKNFDHQRFSIIMEKTHSG